MKLINIFVIYIPVRLLNYAGTFSKVFDLVYKMPMVLILQFHEQIFQKLKQRPFFICYLLYGTQLLKP